ncbi:MAG: hypothetical protein QOH43_4310 [Solirubrobacteraceae bacterium]|jgi:hypothetical protein|nr:hypothetical protein [Solirubrobacteraceae bacterium]
MTRDEARRRCAELNRGSADRAAGRWIAQDLGARGWRVVHVRAPGLGTPAGPLAGFGAWPWPELPPDPRHGLPRDVPPYGAA